MSGFAKVPLERQPQADLNGPSAAKLGALRGNDTAEVGGANILRGNAEVGVIEKVCERPLQLQEYAFGEKEALLQFG